MSIELGLRNLLLNQPSIAALVPSRVIGGITFQGVFNEDPAQGFNPPYIVITQIDFDPMKSLDGTAGMEMSEIDVDCYAVTYPAAVAIGKAVSDFLKDYTGLAGGSDRIHSVLWNNKRHDAVRLGDGRDVRHHIIGLSFDIQHSEI